MDVRTFASAAAAAAATDVVTTARGHFKGHALRMAFQTDDR